MAPHFGDENKLIALSKQGREQLEAQWAAERQQQSDRQAHASWHSPPMGAPDARRPGDGDT